MIELQDLVNKTVDFRFRGADLRLDLSHALFSSFDVDAGTKLLFKAVGRDELLAGASRVLDAGSGVGVIGLGVAAAFPSARVTLRDRDLLAVAFSERNRQRNKIGNARVEPGLIGAGRLGSAWDYILSNVPAKAGGPVIAAFLSEARAALAPGGRLAIVVVKPLVEEIRAALATSGFDIVSEERTAMHRAFVVAPAKEGAASAAAAAEADVLAPDPFSPESYDTAKYRRREGDFKLFGKTYHATGYWGLPDFDTIGYPQVAATELLSRFATGQPVRDALVINPGIGHSSIWLALGLQPERLALASRDLLSLVAAGENLAALAAGTGAGEGSAPATRALDPLRLDEEPGGSLDLLVDFADPIPEYDWPSLTWERSGHLVRSGGCLVIAAPPTELFRLEKRRPAGWRLLGEKRKKGAAAAAWRRT